MLCASTTVLGMLPSSMHRKDQRSTVSDHIHWSLSHVWLGLPVGHLLSDGGLQITVATGGTLITLCIRYQMHMQQLTHRIKHEVTVNALTITTPQVQWCIGLYSHTLRSKSLLQSSFVRYCGHGFSLLWTPARRPSRGPMRLPRREEGNWLVC